MPSTPSTAGQLPAAGHRLELRLADGSSQTGWVLADHADTGLFLVRADTGVAPLLPIGAQLQLHRFGPRGETLVQGQGEVAYSSSSGLRVTLTRPLADLERVVNRVERTPIEPAAPEGLAENIVELLRAHLHGGLEHLLDLAERQLTQGANSAVLIDSGLSPRQAHRYFSDLRQRLLPFFMDDLCGPWQQARRAGEASAPDLGTLELVGDEELELWLLRSESAAQLEQALRPLLTELQPRLAALHERLPGTPADALLPEQLLNSIVRACKRIDLPYPLRNLLLHQCRDPAALGIGDFLAALLALLRSADIGSTQPAAAVATGSAPPAAPGGGVLDRPMPTTAAAPRPVAAGPALAATQRLFALAPRGVPEEPVAPAVSDVQLAQALERLLAQERPLAAAGFAQALRGEAAALAGQKQVALAPQQSEALALLAQLHETLSDDPLLPATFRSWITRLLPALLGTQLAADDPGQQAEGIRSLFGLLEFAAVLCEGRRDAAASQLAGRIDALIEPMTGHRALAPQLLQRACQTLEQMLQRHRRAGAAVEHRVIESCEGQQRLDDARRAAGKEIGLSFVGRKVPAVLAELLDDVIRPNLVLARLQSEAQVWESQLAALQALADACRQARQGELQIAADDLAGVLAEAWSQVAAATPRSDELLAAVVTALSSGAGAWIAYHAPDTGHSGAAANTRLPPGSGAGALELLRAGDWFGFNVAGADPRLLKLAWMAPDRSRFVFVNQLGHKAEDLGSETLTQLLREESVRLLDERDATTIERAWRRMLEGLHNQLAEQATHDSLTGLLNRTEFDRRLVAALTSPQRGSMALLWIGVDHLRMLNENHGMAAGDAALIAVAQNLRRFVEQRQAQAARIAGDEFVLLLTNSSDDAVAGIARTLCREIAERELQWQGQRFRLAVSIGLVIAGAEPCSAESLLQDAERAYRLARENGGGRVYRHADDDDRLAKLRQTAAWVGRLEQALAQRQLLLFAQPACSLSETARQGPDYVEILLRLEADGEIWTPEQFLLAAERYGQISAIDRFVSEELLRQIRTIAKGPPLRVAFNLSARNLVDGDFVNELVARLRQQDFPLTQLCVELTETAAVAHLSEARTGMQRLSDLGLSMVLDDFGSGYASYQYLKHLPVDLVKVDGAFIRDIAQSPENLALARSINEIAHLLGKQTVAEHVEDEDTLALVREIGFDYAQGFHIRRPEPFADFLARLRTGG